MELVVLCVHRVLFRVLVALVSVFVVLQVLNPIALVLCASFVLLVASHPMAAVVNYVQQANTQQLVLLHAIHALVENK
jgi:hypothetical protein